MDVVVSDYATSEEVRTELRRRIAEAGSLSAFARKAGFQNHTPISLALSESRPITEAVANAAGFMAETVFRRIGRK